MIFPLNASAENTLGDIYTVEKSVLYGTSQNGFVDLKKLPNKFECRKKHIFKSTKPYKFLHLHTCKKPSLQNLHKLRTKPKKVGQVKTKPQNFVVGFGGFDTCSTNVSCDILA